MSYFYINKQDTLKLIIFIFAITFYGCGSIIMNSSADKEFNEKIDNIFIAFHENNLKTKKDLDFSKLSEELESSFKDKGINVTTQIISQLDLNTNNQLIHNFIKFSGKFVMDLSVLNVRSVNNAFASCEFKISIYNLISKKYIWKSVITLAGNKNAHDLAQSILFKLIEDNII